MKSHIITTSLAAVAAANIAHGAISVVGSPAVAENTATPGNTLTISGFSLGAGNAIVVSVSTEHDNGSSAPAISVTYGGVALTNSVSNNQGGQGAAVLWAIDPSITTGDVIVTLGPVSANTRGSVSVLSLSNVASAGAVDSDVSVGGATITLDYTGTAGGMVVAGYVDNGSATGGSPTITGGNIDTTTQVLANNANGASSGMIQAYGDITADGSYSEVFTPSRDNSTRNAAALVAFTAVVPEPSSSLLALSGCSLLFLRRRRHA